MRQSQRARHLGDDRIAVEPEKAHGGGEHAGALVVGLVQQLPRSGGDDGMRPVAEMRRRHHGAQRRLDRSPRIGQEGRDAGERLVGLGVEDMEDRADQQRMAGLLPMIAPLERAFRIDQDVGDVLDVADLPLAAADLEQRIVGGGLPGWSDRTAARGRSARASRRSAASSRP